MGPATLKHELASGTNMNATCAQPIPRPVRGAPRAQRLRVWRLLDAVTGMNVNATCVLEKGVYGGKRPATDGSTVSAEVDPTSTM